MQLGRWNGRGSWSSEPGDELYRPIGISLPLALCTAICNEMHACLSVLIVACFDSWALLVVSQSVASALCLLGGRSSSSKIQNRHMAVSWAHGLSMCGQCTGLFLHSGQALSKGRFAFC